MEIRRALVEDARGIAAIHVRSWQEAYRGLMPEEFLRSLSIEQREWFWRDALQNPVSDVWVAEEAGSLLGWISTGASPDPDADDLAGALRALYIDPIAWRRGIGRALWQVAEAQLRASGYQSVTLWVLSGNQRAQRFYESIGFAMDGNHAKTSERGGATLVELRMRCRLL